MNTTPFSPDKLSALLIGLALLNGPISTAYAKTAAPTASPASEAATGTPASSQSAKLRTVTVRQISFSGLQTIKESELLKSLPIKAGEQITIPGQQIPGLLQYLWNLQYFSSIEIGQTELGGDNIGLTFRVTEFPILESIEFQGNDKYKD